MQNKNVFVLFSCDSWISRDSMRLQGIFTSFKKLQTAVSVLLANDTFLCKETGITCKECAACTDAKSINDMVNYCFIEEIELNQLQ